LTLSTPWKVHFDPKWGGPAQIEFAQLEDWSKHSQPGIRYYSGKATYTTSFEMAHLDRNQPYFLSLGNVSVIAEVKCNGHDLGVVWCEPWRVAVPAGVLQPSGNVLEITVANLWLNRLIRDSGLPESERLTWMTGNPFHPADPLLASGLLGPVALQTPQPGDM
jgi:hypothetical protein